MDKETAAALAKAQAMTADTKVEGASEWFKLKEKGDQIIGVFQQVEFIPAKDGFGAQKAYTLVLANGDERKVGIPDNKKRVHEAVKRAAKGDIVGFRLADKLPPKIKGQSPTNVIEAHYVATAEGDASRKFEAEAKEAGF